MNTWMDTMLEIQKYHIDKVLINDIQNHPPPSHGELVEPMTIELTTAELEEIGKRVNILV